MAEDNAVHGGGGEQARQPGQETPADRDDRDQGKDRDRDDQHDDRHEEDEQEPQQDRVGRLVSAAIIVLTSVAVALVILDTNRNPRTDDAEVFANYIGLAPIVNGPIDEVNIHDNQQVHAGDVLFRIDPRPYRYSLEQALSQQAQLEGQIVDESRRIRSLESAATAAVAHTRSSVAEVGAATATIDQAVADVNDSEASLARAKADYNYSVNNLKRYEPLLLKQFVTVDQVDQLRTGTAMKELAVRQAEAELRLSQARLQSDYQSLSSAQATAAQSAAQGREAIHSVTTLESYTAQRGARLSSVQSAQYNLNHCEIRAPFDARVTNLTLSEGAYARAGQQVFTLIDTRVWWVVANFRETQLRRVLPGMHADVYLMSNPGRMYRGVVENAAFGVTPDAGTVGTITQGLPDAQRTLSWVHLASRFPVRIRIIDPAPNQFRIAQSAVAVVRGWNGW